MFWFDPKINFFHILESMKDFYFWMEPTHFFVEEL